MVAVIGLGRSVDGALLSSEDVEILRTVSGYVAVAIENGLLYKDQQERASELKLLKEFNESIIESINVGLLAVDLDGRVTRLNSALEHILDLRRDAAVGKRVEDLFSEDFADTLKQVLGKDAWRLKEIRNIYKLHTATRANRSLVLNIALAPLQDAQGQTGALVVLEDVTARITLEEQLQQREKLSSIGLLAAGVAHEVNTPLTGVSSYTQMLLGMLNDNDPKHALLQKVRTQAERATNIVNNLPAANQTLEYTQSLYPGDAYVDWVGLSGYYRPPYREDQTPTFDYTFGRSLDQLRTITDKPILLAEIGASESGGDKPAWVTDLFDAFTRPENDDIVGLVWFNLPVTTILDGEPFTNDWRITSRPSALQAFVDGISDPAARF